MSLPLTNAEKNVWETINNFQGQLDSTFKSNQIVHDFAPLKGFLSFADSKLTRMVTESMREQQATYEDARKECGADIIDSQTVPLILRLYWEKICYPIFKWFQAWRKMLLPKTPKEQIKHVEFRRMNAKLTKFFKSTHKFYYNVLEDLAAHYDCSDVLPKEILHELNLHEKESDQQIKLDSNSNFTVFIVTTLHSCLLYLGAAHRYKTTGEKVINKFQVQDFKKSIRYLDLACLVLPSIGEVHLQKGLIYVQTDNLGYAIYQFARSALARIPSRAAQTNFANIICDKNSQLHQKVNQTLTELSRQVSDRAKIVNREVIEYYFLALFASSFSPLSWLNPAKEGCLQNGLQLNALRNDLYETIKTRNIKNFEAIFEELITVIGGFDLLLINCRKGTDNFDPRTTNLKDLKKNHLSYLTFSFDFITLVLNVVRESWLQNLENYHYLAMVRIVECWLKSNRAALQYSHRDENFCRALALLSNDLLKSDMFDLKTLSTVKPVRSYYFQEDVRLKEFSGVKNALTDFNDTEIFSMEDSAARLMGYVPEEEKLDHIEEASLRAKAIIASGQKFFVKNSCGIVWNSQKSFYELPKRSLMEAPKQTNSVVVKRVEIKPAKTGKKNNVAQGIKMLSVTELEEKLERTRQGPKLPQWGYSGSSAPSAPESFKIKPSSELTERLSSRSVVSEDSDRLHSSSSTLSSLSPRSEEKCMIETSALPNEGPESVQGQPSTRTTSEVSSLTVELSPPKEGPVQALPTQMPQSIGPGGFQPHGMMYAPVQPIGSKQVPFTHPMVYPPNGMHPYAQPPLATAQGFGHAYPPNAWPGQPYYQQAHYPVVGHQQLQQSQYQLQGQPHNLAANQAAQFGHMPSAARRA